MSNMRVFPLAVALALLSGCDSVGPEASFDIELETSLTMAQGDVVEITVTIQRGEFDGPITFSVQQAALGVSASFSPSIVTGTETILTVETTGDAPPGAAAITIAASGEGAPTRTKTLDATIHLRGSYMLELIATKVTVAQGGWGSAGVIFRRFSANAGAVALAISGLPAGVTTSPSTTTDGPGTSIAFSASASAQVGSHPITITSSAAGTPPQSVTLSLVVIAPPATSNVSLAFCPKFVLPWFAFQNEGYGWQRVTPSGNTFSFGATDRVAIAYAFGLTDGGSFLIVRYQTREELSHWSDSCSGDKTINGSVSGLASGQRARVAMAGSGATVTSTSPNFTLTGVPEGAYELVAARGNIPTAAAAFRPDRFILRRGVNAAAGSTLPTLDFGAEGFAPMTSALAISGSAGDEDVDWSLYFDPVNGGVSLLQSGGNEPLPTTMNGFPASAFQSGDLQQLVVVGETVEDQPFRFRTRGQYAFFEALSAQSVSLPPPLSNIVIELAAVAPYPRVRARIASQPSYDAAAQFDFWHLPGTTKRVVLIVTAAYLGGTPATWELVVPDFGDLSALGGNPAWLFEPVDGYYAEAMSSPSAIWFGARPKPGDILRIATDYRDFPVVGAVELRRETVGNGAAARAAPLHERGRGIRSQLAPRFRMR